MNPEENNPLTNSGAPSFGAPNQPAGMPGVGGLSMADSLASAEDNLTSAGMAANTGSNVMGLSDISASNPEAIMTPPIDEPLVPAAPVPGSIGSVTSVPANPTDQAAGSAFTPVEAAAPVSPLAATDTPVQPFNPFATNTNNTAASTTDNPMGNAPVASSPATSTTPNFGSSTPSASAMPNPNPNPASAFQPAAGVTPMGKTRKSMDIKTIVMGGIIAVLLVALIIFIILWVNAINNPKIVYVAQPDGDSSNSSIEMLSCTHENDFNFLIGYDHEVIGSESIVASFSNDKLLALTHTTQANFDSPEDAAVARDNLANYQSDFVGILGDGFMADYTTDGNIVTGTIESRNNQLTNEAATVLVYGVDGTGGLSLDEVQSHYEAEGYTCSVD